MVYREIFLLRPSQNVSIWLSKKNYRSMLVFLLQQHARCTYRKTYTKGQTVGFDREITFVQCQFSAMLSHRRPIADEVHDRHKFFRGKSFPFLNRRRFFLFLVTSSVRIKLLDVPEVATAGNDVVLTCDYDLERGRLYQLKWYKGTHEFYRYSPSEERRTKLFLVENLRVDVSN